MRKYLVLAVFGAFLATFAGTGHARAHEQAGRDDFDPKAQWQWSTTSSFKLGIRDKNGDLNGYTATFVVEGEDGQKYQIRRKVAADKFAFVTFPDDFASWAPSGKYTWQGMVNGQVVVSDSFELP